MKNLLLLGLLQLVGSNPCGGPGQTTSIPHVCKLFSDLWTTIAQSLQGCGNESTGHVEDGCGGHYKPVCGINSTGQLVTFPNNCHRRKYGFELFSKGKCSCKKKCSSRFEPVCGENSWGQKITFQNRCVLQSHNCKNYNNRFTQIGRKACQECTACPLRCGRDLKPVCAEYLGKFKTFTNACNFRKFNCVKKKNFTIVEMGRCRKELRNKCPSSCEMTISPKVCAKDNRSGRSVTFTNRCSMLMSNCKKQTEFQVTRIGSCNSRMMQCVMACGNSKNKPVCAKDDKGIEKTFDNECLMNQENCEHNTKYLVTRRGPCKESVSASETIDESVESVNDDEDDHGTRHTRELY